MKLEKQVCSLELAKKLKELGVKQNSLWFWRTDSKDTLIGRATIGFVEVCSSNETLGCGSVSGAPEFYNEIDTIDLASAFTVAELGEMLPAYLDDRNFLYTYKDDVGKWRIHYDNWGGEKPFLLDKVNPEANARASMLIYLIENKLLLAPKQSRKRDK